MIFGRYESRLGKNLTNLIISYEAFSDSGTTAAFLIQSPRAKFSVSGNGLKVQGVECYILSAQQPLSFLSSLWQNRYSTCPAIFSYEILLQKRFSSTQSTQKAACSFFDTSDDLSIIILWKSAFLVYSTISPRIDKLISFKFSFWISDEVKFWFFLLSNSRNTGSSSACHFKSCLKLESW